jgi:hypothetical protein
MHRTCLKSLVKKKSEDKQSHIKASERMSGFKYAVALAQGCVPEYQYGFANKTMDANTVALSMWPFLDPA